MASLSSSRLFSSLLLAGVLVSFSHPALAVTDEDIQKLQKSVEKQESLIQAQQKSLQTQSKKLENQKKKIAQTQRKLKELAQKIKEPQKDSTKDDTKIAEKSKLDDQFAQVLSENKITSLDAFVIASKEELRQEVGAGKKGVGATASIMAPKKKAKRPEVMVLPDVGGVLTPKGLLMYESSLEYVNTTNNVFTFNGVQVAEVVFVGITNATTAKRQIIQNSHRFRLGITNRLEADIRVPYVYRTDTTSETNTTTNVTTRSTLEGNGFGDIDSGLSYQLDHGQEDWPFLVANLRYKMANANGPFDVNYDSNNIATELPSGTGYHSLEASMTAIKVSDPAVLFANLGYVHNFDTSIDKTFGDTKALEISPGDAINVSGGLGFSINPKTSFSLGYKHSYVFPTTQFNQTVSTGGYSKSESDSASVGALLIGASYRINDITSINFNAEVGATREAPDVRIGVRIPVRLGKLF